MTDRLRCPLCGGAGKVRFDRHGIDIADCGDCGHRFAAMTVEPDHVARTYGDEYFFGGGAGYRDYLAEADLLRAAGARYGHLMARHSDLGRVVDVGAAAGYLLAGMTDAGWQGIGLEPNRRMADHARTALGLEVLATDFDHFTADEPADAIAFVQVIAHLRDPAAALARAYEMVRPGGIILLETWDRDSRTARLFGRHWHEYSPPSVLHWFNRAGLETLGRSCGFDLVAAGRPIKRLNAGHAASLLRHKLGARSVARLLALPLRLVPDRLVLRYPFDDLFWMILRKPVSEGRQYQDSLT